MTQNNPNKMLTAASITPVIGGAITGLDLGNFTLGGNPFHIRNNSYTLAGDVYTPIGVLVEVLYLDAASETDWVEILLCPGFNSDLVKAVKQNADESLKLTWGR